MLKGVLLIPQFQCNLICVSQPCIDENCLAAFYLTHMNFQDRATGRIVGTGNYAKGIYHLQLDSGFTTVGEVESYAGKRSVTATTVADLI